jgi:hypothetical protein
METIKGQRYDDRTTLGGRMGTRKGWMMKEHRFDATGAGNQGIRGESRQVDEKHVVRTVSRHRT